MSDCGIAYGEVSILIKRMLHSFVISSFVGMFLYKIMHINVTTACNKDNKEKDSIFLLSYPSFNASFVSLFVFALLKSSTVS